MTAKEELQALRTQIDEVSAAIVRLFNERQRLSTEVARVKDAGNLAITDANREEQVVAAAVAASEPENRAAAISLTRTLIALSKLRQNEQLALPTALDFPAPVEPTDGVVAFQGVAGAWSEQCAQTLYPEAEKLACAYFEDVFEAVKSGKAAYGVLPIENSRTGAIGEVYDLLRRHSCFIVGELWLSVAQSLLAAPGARLTDIREVFSHPEGFSQCARFLKNRSWELTSVRNTAVAAQMVAEKAGGADGVKNAEGVKFAAIGSPRAAEVYGLEVLAPDVMDDRNNRTRFIVIAAAPQYNEQSTSVTVTFSTQHRSGALCSVLEAFMLAGVNLTRIESRPVSAERYRFFADLAANITDPATRDAINIASMHCDYFEVLGCYSTSEETK
ncbi:MAG: chorismate mutase [Oscillospiraceae bacterium]|jgi:chorismate mutase/prephenate dehydratase|nr:chorismate mutase [Oscillospiraceae bacterium]